MRSGPSLLDAVRYRRRAGVGSLLLAAEGGVESARLGSADLIVVHWDCLVVP